MVEWEQKRRAAEAYQRFRAQERSSASLPVAGQAKSAGESKSKSWWDKAKGWAQQHIVQPVQQAVPKVMNWVDQHQTQIAIGVGIAAGVAAIVLSGGAATPLVAAAWMAGSAAVAGGIVAVGTLGLNAYFHRPLTTNLWRNVGYAAGAAAVTATAGFVLQAIAPTVTRAAAQFCLSHVTTCTVASPVLKAADYGWTQYDIWQATRTLNNSKASFSEKLTAGLTIGLSVWGEALEPDELCPLSLPLDDVVRREITEQFARIVERDGIDAGFKYLENVLGDKAPQVIAEILKKVGSEQYVRVTQQSGRIARVLNGYADEIAEIGTDGFVRVNPDVVQRLQDNLVKSTGLKVWATREKGVIYVSRSTQEGVQYATELAIAHRIGKTDEVANLVKKVAEASTRGKGNRVVLGVWQEGGGYIGEAVENGGIFFDAGAEVWEMLKASGVDPWEVNEAFLRQQLEAGVERIDFVGVNVDELLDSTKVWERKPYRVLEAEFLEANAERYGYVRSGNSWIRGISH